MTEREIKELPGNFFRRGENSLREGRRRRTWKRPRVQEITSSGQNISSVRVSRLFISVNRYSKLGSPLADIWLRKIEPATVWRSRKAVRLCEMSQFVTVCLKRSLTKMKQACQASGISHMLHVWAIYSFDMLAVVAGVTFEPWGGRCIQRRSVLQ